MRTRLCFVCLGNICRSPTAEGAFRHVAAIAGASTEFEVDSAGTAAYHVGEAPDQRSAACAQERGIDISGRARRFEAADFARFDLVLAMDRNNLRDLQGLASTQQELAKLKLLRDYDPEASGAADVPDPYYGGSDGFSDVLDMCLRSCTALLAEQRAAAQGRESDQG